MAVLRRRGRAGDQPLVRRFFDERIEEELRRAFHCRVEALQKIEVLGEEVVFPEILAEPRAAGGPVSPRAVNGRRRAPEVGVVVRDPATGAPVHLRGARAGLREVLHHPQERFDALAEIARLGRPVVHLGVDVDGVFAAPGRVHAVGPEALQIGRLPARTRAGEEQVAAKLEVKRRKLRVVSIREVLDALVGRQLHRLGGAEVQRNPAEQPLVFGNVRLAQSVKGLPARGSDVIPRQGLRVAADILEALVTRRRRDEQHGGIGVGHGNLVRVRRWFAAGSNHFDAGLELQRAGDAIGRAVDAAQHERVRPVVGGGGLLRRVETRGERNLARFVGGDAHDDHLVHGAGEEFAGELDAAGGVTDAGDGRVEVQVAAIIGHGVHFGEAQHQITDGLIRHLAARFRDHLLVHELVGLAILAFEHQPPRLGQCRQRLRVVLVVRAAAPKRVFIKLETLVVDAAENHRAEPAAADGERFSPDLRGPAIPETERLFRRRRLAGVLAVELRQRRYAGTATTLRDPQRELARDRLDRSDRASR